MSSQLSGALVVASQSLYEESSSATTDLGALVFTNDGRAFRYAKCGSTTALVSGTLLQSSAEDTADQNLTAVAAAIGDTSLVSTSTITVTANEYAGGLAIISVTPGIGKAYKIKNHAAYTAAAPTLTLEDSIQVALTTDSRIDLVRNPYNGVVVNPTTVTSAPTGVALKALTASYFGWVQVGGIAPILADGALGVGDPLVASNGTAGAVERGAGVAGTQSLVGTAVTGIATGEVGAVKLKGLL